MRMNIEQVPKPSNVAADPAKPWGRLSPDLQRRVALDLAKAEIVGTEKFRVVLSMQSERVQGELRAAMLATGLSSKEVEKRLGF